MRVSFINPAIFPYKKIMRDFDCAGESKGNYLYQPYDFLLLSAFVPHEWSFNFIDAVADQISHQESIEQLIKHNPEIIVCSVAGINWLQDFSTLKEIRDTFPRSFLFVFGDLFVDDYPRREALPIVDGILSSPVMFDFSILSGYSSRQQFDSSKYEAFHQLSNLPNKTLKAAKEIRVPIPRHESFVNTNYRWPFAKSFHYTTVFTSWGCPYSCSYCILNKFPNYWRNYNEIIAEMIAVKKLGFQELYIGDKSFGLPSHNIMSLLDEMIRLKLNFSWSTYFHPNQYSRKLLNKMKAAGCHTIIIGVESQNFQELKKYGRHVREEQFKELIEHDNEINMEICGDFILGLPHDNHQSLISLIEYACDLKIDYASFNVATPLPGSSLRELALNSQKIQIHEQQFDSSGHNQIVEFSELSKEEISKFRRLAVKKFYLRPKYLLRRLTRTRNLEHLVIQFDEARELISSALR
jgi:radical SAM superfamily enzyme YgiQ (UPF0313 family)